MRKAEQSGMQGLARECGNPCPDRSGTGNRSPGTRAIDRVTDQRVAEMGEVNTDLMGPPRSKAAFDLRGVSFEGARDPIAGDRRLPLSFRHDCHFLAVRAAAADVAGDLTRRR